MNNRNILLLLLALFFTLLLIEISLFYYYKPYDQDYFIGKNSEFFNRISYREKSSEELEKLYTFDILERESENSILGRELIPGSAGVIGGKPVSINSDGFRDREYDIEKPRNTIRIAVLGDSFTFGDGLLVNETYVKVLERELNKDSDTEYEVINFGIYGYDVSQITELYDEKIKKFNPDIVMYGYFPNDPRGALMGCNMAEKEKQSFIRKQQPLSLYFLNLHARKIYNNLLYGSYIGYHIGLHSEEYIGWHCTIRHIKSLNSKTDNFVLFPIPIIGEFDIMNKTVYSTLKATGVNYFNLPGFFETEEQDYNLSEFYSESHYSGLAHEIFAEGIIEYLIENDHIKDS